MTPDRSGLGCVGCAFLSVMALVLLLAALGWLRAWGG